MPVPESYSASVHVTPEQLRHFGEFGWVLIPGVLSPATVTAALGLCDALIRETPPPAGRVRHHFYWPDVEPGHPIMDVLLESPAYATAQRFIDPGRLITPWQAQISLNIPYSAEFPGRGHLDGLTPPAPDGRPYSFTLLAGLMLTDQREDNMGNLWVWPGTHLSNAAYLREHGPDRLLETEGWFGLPQPQPQQIRASAGDLLLAHYLLNHNMGGNTSTQTRKVIYFRLQREGHRSRWRDCVQDPLVEFDSVRHALESA